jgi:hypothetical protein
MRTSRHAAVLVACVMMAPALAQAQGTIAGTVRDASGALLPGVTVEAASPALIERVRTAPTDGTGQYRIIDLRPGIYTVTFRLPGFSAVIREGIELSGTFTATVNAELRVGSLEETITVSGETPIVDVQSAGRRSSISGEVISEIPSARLYHSIVQLVPGVVTSGPPDVGGASGPVFKLFSVHGGRGNEGQVQVDGMSTGAALNGAGVSYYVPDVGTSEEVEVRLTGGTAETERGGPVMSVVPRTGGNSFRGLYFTSGASGSWQSDNFTDEMREAIAVAGELRKVWDVNGAVGGPILRDRLWFYATGRHHGNRRFVTGMFLNRNAGDPNAWTYEPDTDRRATDGGTWMNSSVRLTLQASSRNKLNIFWDEQWTCSSGCLRGSVTGGTPTTSPEAHQPTMSYPSKVQQVTWTSPATNRLLLEAGYGNYLARWGGPQRPDNNPDLIRVQDQGGPIPNIFYRGQNWSLHYNGQHNWRASGSYITGAHNMKFGYQGQYLAIDLTDYWNNHQVWYRLNDGVPNRVTMTANPATTYNRAQSAALYAQDQWTRRQLTVQGGLRWDRAWSYFPEQQVGPGRFVPDPFVLAPTRGVRFNDITMRAAAAYDLFGNGRTAIKANIGEYLEAVQNSGRYVQSNPRNLVVTSAFRSWTDVNGNMEPDCDLLNPAAQNLSGQGGDICGAWSNQLFGSSTQGTAWNPALLSGWGVRPNDWAVGLGVQHEIAPRVSAEVSYNRRWFPTRNFTVTDNRAVTNADYDPYSIVAPQDPRLPGGGGYVIDDLWDIKPDMFGVESDNYVTSASDFGTQMERWHGVDVNFNVRLGNGVRFQGGTSTGRRITDNCEIRPNSPSRRFCRVEEPFNTQIKGLGSYTIPRIDVLVSGTLQSNPGPSRNANMVVPAGPGSALRESLGRPLASGANTVTINLVGPWELRGDRVTQVDFRIAKLVRYGGRRTMLSLDLYNALNANPILGQIQTYGPSWLNPTSVMDARFVRLSAQLDF